MGAKTTYTEAMADAIVEWIAEGKTLREFCRQPNTPGWRTVYLWREAHPEFEARIARARDIGHDAIAEQALQIADTPQEGVRTERSEDGTKEIREDMLGHRKLQIYTRLQLLAKWNPKKYGDRAALELTGKDGGPIETKSADTLTDEQLAAIASAGRARNADTGSGSPASAESPPGEIES